MIARIRFAKISDFEKLLRLVAAYYEFDSIAFDKVTTGRALHQLLRAKSLGRVWVIDMGAALAGYSILTYNFDLEFGGLEGILTDFFIAPRHRRKGLGRQLIDAVRKFCASEEIATIELQVTRDNRDALEFYRALGFESLDRIVMSIESK
jgi:ribosomal protein S18 acetylase RimI-like enzyme